MAYKQDFDAVRAAEDMAVFEGLAPGEVSPRLARSVDGPGTHRLGLYVSGDPLSLGEVLPVLQSLGVEVVDERPYEIAPVGTEQSRIYEFTLYYPSAPVEGFDNFAARFGGRRLPRFETVTPSRTRSTNWSRSRDSAGNR